jgi:hypothetical protein
LDRKLSIDSAIFLAASTALLYTWSTASYHGFFQVLRLDSDMMERSFHQVIYDGLIIAFFPTFAVLACSAFLLYLYAHLLLPEYVDWVRKSVKSKRKIIKIRRFWRGKRNAAPVELRSKAFFSRVTVLTISVFLYIGTLAHFEHEGREKANEVIGAHLAGKSMPTEMIEVGINGNPKTLRFLGCGARNCAGIEAGTNFIYYFSSSSGYSFLYQEPKVVVPKESE